MSNVNFDYFYDITDPHYSCIMISRTEPLHVEKIPRDSPIMKEYEQQIKQEYKLDDIEKLDFNWKEVRQDLRLMERLSIDRPLPPPIKKPKQIAPIANKKYFVHPNGLAGQRKTASPFFKTQTVKRNKSVKEEQIEAKQHDEFVKEFVQRSTSPNGMVRRADMRVMNDE